MSPISHQGSHRAEGDFHKERDIYICIVERTNKADARLEEQSQKMESFKENLWNEIQLKGPQRQKYTLEQNSGQARLVYVRNM